MKNYLTTEQPSSDAAVIVAIKDHHGTFFGMVSGLQNGGSYGGTITFYDNATSATGTVITRLNIDPGPTLFEVDFINGLVAEIVAPSAGHGILTFIFS